MKKCKCSERPLSIISSKTVMVEDVPYEELKYKYPILKRHKYLYPLMLLRRCFFAVFTKKSKQIKKEMQISAEASKINQEETIKLIDYLGLKEI